MLLPQTQKVAIQLRTASCYNVIMNSATITYDDTIIRGLHTSQSIEAANAILQLDFSGDQQERMHELASKARAGDLSEAERSEADSFERVSSLLGILRSKARMTLKQAM